MPIASASRLLRTSSGQSKRFLAALVLAHAPVQKNCMTLHDAEARPNLHFLSSPATLGESQKSLVFPRILPTKTGLWLGAESNRRHVDFQSTALPTELPSRDRRRFCVAVGFPLSNNLVVGQPRRLSELPYKNFVTADAPDRNISQARVWHSLCRLDLQLQSAT